MTCLSDDVAATAVVDRLSEAGVAVRAVRQRRQLVVKTRYLVDSQKVMKVDDGSPDPLDSRSADRVADLVESAAAGADAVIFADFGYGLLTGPLLDRVLPAVREAVPVVTADVSGRRASLLRFAGVDLLCPTERELREATGDFASGINAVASRLLSTTSARAALVTLGKQGPVRVRRVPPRRRRRAVGPPAPGRVPAVAGDVGRRPARVRRRPAGRRLVRPSRRRQPAGRGVPRVCRRRHRGPPVGQPTGHGRPAVRPTRRPTGPDRRPGTGPPGLLRTPPCRWIRPGRRSHRPVRPVPREPGSARLP